MENGNVARGGVGVCNNLMVENTKFAVVSLYKVSLEFFGRVTSKSYAKRVFGIT